MINEVIFLYTNTHIIIELIFLGKHIFFSQVAYIDGTPPEALFRIAEWLVLQDSHYCNYKLCRPSCNETTLSTPTNLEQRTN